jgi:large subunit ribosomal protein L32
MAQPKRKTSKMKKRQRKAPSRYAGIQANECTNCAAPVLPHHACASCGFYGGKAVIEVEAAVAE